MQDFPYKSAQDSNPSPFENDLVEYLQALEVGWPFTLLVTKTFLVYKAGRYVDLSIYVCVWQVPKR